MPTSQTRPFGNPDSFCEPCYRQFSSPSKLADHFCTSSTHSQSFCSTCHILFPDAKSLLKHQKSSPKHHFCHPCFLDFSSSEKLNSHYCHSSDHHFCTLCQELFVNGEALARHVGRHHWNCDKCGVYFASVKYLKSHYKDVAGHAYCDKCDEGFCDKAGLEKHIAISDNHSICVACKREFGSAEKLNKHIKTCLCLQQNQQYCQTSPLYAPLLHNSDHGDNDDYQNATIPTLTRRFPQTPPRSFVQYAMTNNMVPQQDRAHQMQPLQANRFQPAMGYGNRNNGGTTITTYVNGPFGMAYNCVENGNGNRVSTQVVVDEWQGWMMQNL